MCFNSAYVSAEVTSGKELFQTAPDKDQAKLNLSAASLMTGSPGNHILCLLHGGELTSTKWVDTSLCLQQTFQYWGLSCIFMWRGDSFGNKFFFQWNSHQISCPDILWKLSRLTSQFSKTKYNPQLSRIEEKKSIWNRQIQMKKMTRVLQLVSFSLGHYSSTHSETTKGTLMLFIWHEWFLWGWLWCWEDSREDTETTQGVTTQQGSGKTLYIYKHADF